MKKSLMKKSLKKITKEIPNDDLWDLQNLRLDDWLKREGLESLVNQEFEFFEGSRLAQLHPAAIPIQLDPKETVKLDNDGYFLRITTDDKNLDKYIHDKFYFRYFEWVRKGHYGIPEIRKELGIQLGAPEQDQTLFEKFNWKFIFDPKYKQELDAFLGSYTPPNGEKKAISSYFIPALYEFFMEKGLLERPDWDPTRIMWITNPQNNKISPYGWTRKEIYEAIHQTGLPITGAELHGFDEEAKFKGSEFHFPGTAYFIRNYMEENPQATQKEAYRAFNDLFPFGEYPALDQNDQPILDFFGNPLTVIKRNKEEIDEYWATHDKNIPKNPLSSLFRGWPKIYYMTLYRLLGNIDKEMQALAATQNLVADNDFSEIDKIYRKSCQDLKDNYNLPQLRGMAKGLGFQVKKSMTKEDLCQQIAISVLSQETEMNLSQIFQQALF